MKTHYMSEIEGMTDFYQELQITPSYVLNTDGVIRGTLFEFKKTRTSDGGKIKHLEQIKRYLKAYNSAALQIPSISFLIYLNSQEFIKIDNFTGDIIEEGCWKTPIQFKDFVVKNNQYLKGYIDEYSFASYNNLFCEKFNSEATKELVKEEFINPRFLNINSFDWNKQLDDEKKEKDKIGWLHFNMNQLGNQLLKKQLGAFFTPEVYVRKSTQYIRDAIKRSRELGYEDYIIVDRCAGTGNLEKFLREDELKHCILNTFDYTEWTTLKGLYEGRVKLIIPPTNEYRTESGLLKNGDALSEEFNKYIQQQIFNKIDRTKTYVIFLENPPFRDETSTLTKKDKNSKKTFNYISDLMNKDPKIKGAIKNELSIKFIWSAWNLFNPNEYILFSPIKYWKTYHLIDKKYYAGYITNKKDYNANYDAGLPVIAWSNEDYNQDALFLENGKINKIHHSIKTLLDKRKNENYFAKMFIMAGDIRPIGTSLDNGKQIINDTPCLINEENILFQLPLWVAAKYETNKDRLELNILMKSGDGKDAYKKDKKFLKKCFIWSCLTNYNKCISDGNELINELTLSQNTLCDKILLKLELDEKDQILLNLWEDVLNEIKNKQEFIKGRKYGLNQIIKEINIKIFNGSYNKKNEEIKEIKYIDLDFKIKKLKKELKIYYNNFLKPKIFEYELIK
ncbi:hypothetical protein [Williamsoniiplasma luminosum]|uniref:Uncharacterized protein n=1 Tax=Williamsoniiplasma luminosum TaxID=214888 RepID=A0A2S0NJ35_9MOLU|nr:hypothetical protein [Williamsoniiplasma luminosum]AVP49012.1 MAG: hypothetical protein C5T88_00205 [Williamsoniiplasma luminosum]